jgi:hypothetical protein
VLEWTPGSDGWTLRAGEDLVASLRLTSLATETAEAQTAERQWHFTVTGMVSRKLTVHDAGAPDGPVLLEVRRNLRHVWTVPAGDGRDVHWRVAGLTSPDWVCTAPDGRRLIYLRVGPGSAACWASDLDMTGQVHLEEAARPLPGLSLTVVIGWYLLVLYRMDARSFSEG